MVIYLNICNKCGTELEGEDLIKGCPKCGSKVFKFIKTKDTSKTLKNLQSKSHHEGNQFSRDSIESIRVKDNGIYELNLNQILSGETSVFSDDKGNYAIDIAGLLKKSIEDKQKNNGYNNK